MKIKTTNFTNFNSDGELLCPFCNTVAFQEEVMRTQLDLDYSTNDEQTYCNECHYAEEKEAYTNNLKIVGHSYYFYKALKAVRDSGKCNMLDINCIIDLLTLVNNQGYYTSVITWISNNKLDCLSFVKVTFDEYEQSQSKIYD